MKISEFAKSSHVGIETIRYYQRIGLLDVGCSHGKYREYTHQDLSELQFIKNAKNLKNQSVLF